MHANNKMTDITPTPESKKRKYSDKDEEKYLSNRAKRRRTEKEFSIGPYMILEELGSGAYGTVFKAKEVATGRIVAIKKLTIGEETNETEIKILEFLKRICDEYFLCFYHVLKDKNHLYLVSEYLDGYVRLMDFLVQNDHQLEDPIEYEKYQLNNIVLENKILCNIAKAIELLHSLHIAHADLSAYNIMVNPLTGQVKLIDFGMSLMANKTSKMHFDEDEKDLEKIAYNMIGEIEPNEDTPLLNERNNIWESEFKSGEFIAKVKKYICK